MHANLLLLLHIIEVDVDTYVLYMISNAREINGSQNLKFHRRRTPYLNVCFDAGTSTKG